MSCREEAARVWQKRETEWEREREARDRLMAEVSLCFVLPAACLANVAGLGGETTPGGSKTGDS